MAKLIGNVIAEDRRFGDHRPRVPDTLRFRVNYRDFRKGDLLRYDPERNAYLCARNDMVMWLPLAAGLYRQGVIREPAIHMGRYREHLVWLDSMTRLKVWARNRLEAEGIARNIGGRRTC